MSEAIILEFRDASPGLYDAVNKILGLDPVSGAGDWPEGMLCHAAGEHADGNGITVWEIWESREAQDAFMSSRLGPALGQAGAPEPTRVEWMPLRGYHTS
jgi:hypothetical protein